MPRTVAPKDSLDSLWQDVRYGVRLMRRSPAFTAVAVLSLALGIGANTAIFSVINAIIVRELPVREPGQLVELISQYPGEPRMNHFWWMFYEHYRDSNQVFSDVIGTSPALFELTGEGREPETVAGAYVVGHYFPFLGIQAATGRLIAPDDDRIGGADAAVAVVSWSYWQRRFNLSPSVLGTRIVVAGVPATVIGVSPRGFFGLQVGLSQDVWVPAAMEPLIQRPSRRAVGQLGLQLMARLKPGVTIERARADMVVLDRRRVEEIAARSKNPLWRQSTIEVAPAGTGFSHLRDRLARPLLLLQGIVAVLLLIACSNVASMLLARGESRRREIAMRVAVGAGRARLVRQLLTESVLLSTAGGMLGVGLAYVGADALVRSWPLDARRGGFQIDLPVQPDATVLLFTAAVTLLTGLLFGLAPAWNVCSSTPSSSLREMAAPGETRSRRLFGRSLVVTQVALSVVLLSAAGLFIRHVANLRRADLGFERSSVLLATLDPSRSGYQRAQLSPLYPELLGRVLAIPGVRSATLSAITPIQGGGASRFVQVDGFREDPGDRRYVSLNWVAPRYFETFGTEWVAGRDFTVEDQGRPRVAIVNRAFARYYFPDIDAIGRRFTFEGQNRSYEIVGVVGDAKYSSLREAPPRTIYLHAYQEGPASQLAVRTDMRTAAIAGAVRRAVGDVMKTVPITKMTTLTEQLDASILPERQMARLSGAFGALGALLAALGLYGLLAFTVARRTTEIGIRVALGATRRDVSLMVLKGALGLVAAGLVAGTLIAIWSRRLAASLLEGLPVESAFPIAFGAAAIIVVALLAAYVPARRAAGIDPMEALRRE